MSLTEWLAGQDADVGLVFTDVVQSTSLLFETRTVRYAAIIRAHRNRAVELAQTYDGRLVDQSGDATLATFPDASRAYRFANDLFADTGHPSLQVRVGVHVGSVRAEEGRLIGRSVHLCARVMQRGVEAELWVSDEARRAIEADSGALAEKIAWIDSDDSALKGIPGPHRLWRAA